jgi:hypothetical protein
MYKGLKMSYIFYIFVCSIQTHEDCFGEISKFHMNFCKRISYYTYSTRFVQK